MPTQASLLATIPVVIESSFEEILGTVATDMSERERRDRWAQWLRLCRAEALSEGREMARSWQNASECCTGCKHRRNGWCQLQSLPATVNPVLSFRYGMQGMACMGAGHTSNQ